MAVITSFSLKWAAQHRDVRGSLMMPFVVFVLVMMLSMLVSAVFYFYAPSFNMLVILVVVNMLVMGAGSLPFIFVMFRALLDEEDQVPGHPAVDIQKKPDPSGWERAAMSAAILSLVLLNEFFMGWAFLLASGSAIPAGGPVELFSVVIGSYWFLFTMSLEMALTTFFLRKEIPKSYAYLVAMQSLVMFLSPPALDNPAWVTFAVFAGSAVMVVLYVYAFEYLARNQAADSHETRYILRLMVAYAAMMAGLFAWVLSGSETLFALSIVMEMVVYLNLVLGSKRGVSLSRWASDPWWVLALLLSIFVGEFFMGALLDAQTLGGKSFVGLVGLLPFNGGLVTTVGIGIHNFIAFFAVVSLSPWYLLMMGAEMGALVVFRIGQVRELETKVRLGLVVVAYAAYSFFPSAFLVTPWNSVFMSSTVIPPSSVSFLPFLEWSKGIGTSGPVAPALLFALVGTYVISGFLSFLFGSRQVCSVLCGAALMYQGTFYDSLKTFNGSSRVGRRYLTSRLSGAYKWTAATVWVSLIAAAALSYLDSVGILNFRLFGSDPAFFLYAFYFGFLWYVIWVSIPFVGTYGCVTMGWCSWGTFNQLVSRLGFFKLKVRDPSVCMTCQTQDCARACPVGLTDLPGSFMTKGEFRSMKCIGVGDCVGACPYSNEYFFDVRSWVRQRFRQRVPSPHGGRTIPLLPASPVDEMGFPALEAEKRNAR